MAFEAPKSHLRVDVDITPYRYSGADTHLLAALVTFVVKRCATAEVKASRTRLCVSAMVPAAELPSVDAFMVSLKADVQTECERLRLIGPPNTERDEALLSQLVALLAVHVGETGRNEGAVDTLKRLMAERATARRQLEGRDTAAFAVRPAANPGVTESVCADLTIYWGDLLATWENRARDGAPHALNGVRIIHLASSPIARDIAFGLLRASLEPGGRLEGIGADLNRTAFRATFRGGSQIHIVDARHGHAFRGLRADVLTFSEMDVERNVVDDFAGPLLSEPWSLRQLVRGVPKARDAATP